MTIFPYTPGDADGDWVVTLPPDAAIGEVLLYAEALAVLPTDIDFDTFTRADTGSSLGVTEGQGLTWVMVYGCQWGIDGDRARLYSAGSGWGDSGAGALADLAVINYAADFTASLDVNADGFQAPGTGLGIAFRVGDPGVAVNGFLAILYRPNTPNEGHVTLFLYRFDAGVLTTLDGPIGSWAVGSGPYTLRVATLGPSIVISVDAVEMISRSDSHHLSNTRAGMASYLSTTGYVDSWQIEY